MALVYTSNGPVYKPREVIHILGESNGNAQFIDTSYLVTSEDILSSVTDKGGEDSHAVVGPQALRSYIEEHKVSGPRGYQGYQGIGSAGGAGERGYQGFRGYQGVSGSKGSDYWTTTDPGTWSSGLGNLYALYNVHAVAFYQGSDDRYKDKIADIEGALSDIEKIPTFRYRFKGDERVHLGSSAQSLLNIVPEVVLKSKEDGKLSVTYPELSVYTLAALKELVSVLRKKQIL